MPPIPTFRPAPGAIWAAGVRPGRTRANVMRSHRLEPLGPFTLLKPCLMCRRTDPLDVVRVMVVGCGPSRPKSTGSTTTSLRLVGRRKSICTHWPTELSASLAIHSVPGSVEKAAAGPCVGWRASAVEPNDEAETLAAPRGSATVWCDSPGTTARFCGTPGSATDDRWFGPSTYEKLLRISP